MKASCHPNRRALYSNRVALPWERGLCASCHAAARVRVACEKRKAAAAARAAVPRTATVSRFDRMNGKAYLQAVLSRARRLGGSLGIDVDRWCEIIKSTDGSCIYCQRRSGRLGMSYLVPREKGGPDHPDNVVPACARCIHSKGKRTILEWPAARALLLPTVFQALAARTSALEVKP